ncbi:MAG: hypothetical protein JXA11_00305 [Phycisphaerae bacterium]|nr:hypothetical protein [Phycisphaerae bacterium]
MDTDIDTYLASLKVSFKAAGLILAPRVPRRLTPLFRWLEENQYPFVFLGTAPKSNRYSSGVDDPLGQAKMAMEHLISLGHARISHIAGFPPRR